MSPTHEIYSGQQKLYKKNRIIDEQFKEEGDDSFYEIKNYKNLPPFFMTITSSGNHWMFISSTGGLTAGRVNAESALFPYYTDDKITENYNNTGPETILLVTIGDKRSLWKPFADENEHIYQINSSLSKNLKGNVVVFEEINETLGLSFSYRWMNSQKFGWVRKASLRNLKKRKVDIELIDGLKNVLPAGTSSLVQNTFGNLLNAYKSSELDVETGMGLYALSATLTDLAEPRESLKANTIWHRGLPVKAYLLSDKQLENFSCGMEIESEVESKGARGCYYIHSIFALESEEKKEWYFAADVDRDHCQVNNLKSYLMENQGNLEHDLNRDILNGHRLLEEILIQNDGIQKTSSQMNCVHHKANVLFNVMRGGYFYHSYMISINDLTAFINSVNKTAAHKYTKGFVELGEEIYYENVEAFVHSQNDVNLERIWYEYLPLTFSRRHGDPSRPWNVFSIETEQQDGAAKLDYQGNWRDIFQNWEALSYSYPLYLKHIIGKFLNATTKEGYNPYRITKKGIDWEIPEPGNPWANIGYWSDHQIVYLLKLLEMYSNFYGDALVQELNRAAYTTANVPYEIKSFEDIVHDPYQTIDFNDDKNEKINKLTEMMGSDGKLILNDDGSLFLTTMIDKLMILLLAKLSNFVPDGGIWMNTQRPEWNDANNALVGKGSSVVTLAYVRRYISFLIDLLQGSTLGEYSLQSDTAQWLESLAFIFYSYEKEIGKDRTAEQCFKVVQSLGVAAEKYRVKFYREGLNSETTGIALENIVAFLKSSLICVDDTLRKNRRDDDLYHSYNTLEFKGEALHIHNLYEMLEGQVAILSSGLLSANDADKTLNALKQSAIYREDQNSYMLYPNRTLSGFLGKNNIAAEKVHSSPLLMKLIQNKNRDLILADDRGQYHFNGDFKNVKQVKATLEFLADDYEYSALIPNESSSIGKLFEETFNHQSFTGRSGTFFAFEGLGSIYWHMVSKLLLATQENVLKAVAKGESDEIIYSLKNRYYQIRQGLGYNKSAGIYGAFPFDPYSHTPFGQGAKQPGMTGQVKEEVITRLVEMGIRIDKASIHFDKIMIDEGELLEEEKSWCFRSICGEELNLSIPVNAMAVSFCQVPIIIGKGEEPSITVKYRDKRELFIRGSILPRDLSSEIFKKTGTISSLRVEL